MLRCPGAATIAESGRCTSLRSHDLEGDDRHSGATLAGVSSFTPRPAFDVELADDQLAIHLHRDFDANGKDHDWINLIVARYSGPYASVTIDIAAMGPRVNSSFFSGLYRLHQQYNIDGSHPVGILGAHERAVQGLEILALKSLYRLL